MHPSIRRFLDVEAREDDDDDILDSEEEEESIGISPLRPHFSLLWTYDRISEQFLDDGLEFDSPPSRIPTRSAPVDIRETTLDKLIQKILTTTQTGKITPLYNGTYDDDSAIGSILRMPREGDYPLWRVKCRIGAEEIAVLSLLGTVGPSHQLQSAFTRGSIRGSIYLECTMNTELIQLLRITPGVIRSHQGVHRAMIHPTDQVDLLKMRSQEVEVKEGDWVSVKKGVYSGDVGIVSTVYSWGARLSLVPRLDITSFRPHSGTQSRKRKASAMKPVAKLFDPEEFSSSSTVRMIPMGEGSYSVGLLQFEDGLLAKDFDFHSFSNAITGIPYGHYLLFAQSRHPFVVLSRMPRPLEWFFKENDPILLSSGESGIIRNVGVFSAEIERSDPTQSAMRWIDQIPWHSVRKDVRVGQYVRVHGGPHVGIAGWVISINDALATLATKVLDGEVLDHDNALTFVEVLVNCSEVTEPPLTLHAQEVDVPNGSSPAPEASNPLTQKAIQHPWCGLDVKISRKFHPKKGQTGIVKEVTGRLDGTNVKLLIQLTAYNPSAPFQTITVDYRDVVELKSLKELVRFLDPGPGFCRPTPQPLKNGPKVHVKDVPVGCDAGGQTPLPSSPDASGSAAWDPSSRTPGPWDYLLPPWLLAPAAHRLASDCQARGLSPPPSSSQSHASSSISPSSSVSNPVASPPINLPAPLPVQHHVLLDPRLVGASLNVVVDGGGFSKKELAVLVSADASGVPKVRYVKYRTSTLLKPEWITPKHPNPTHDNGLLIVIQGEHCGKYVRRIHHRRENGVIRTIIVAVVSRSDGQPDQLTGEQLELEVDFLCTVTETKKQKDMNWSVMQEVRERFRKAHR